MIRVVTSPAASTRLRSVHDFLDQLRPSTDVIVVGASRGAADDLCRWRARRSGAAFGVSRASLVELAARTLASAGAVRQTPGSQAAAEAMAARAVHEATHTGALTYFAPVAKTPGFPKALARTLHELRIAGAGPGRLKPDLGHLLGYFEVELARASTFDRAALFEAAANAARASEGERAGGHRVLVFLDVPLDSAAEQRFVAALVASSRVCATVPQGDQRTRAAWITMGGLVQDAADDAPAHTDLASLRRWVFSRDVPPARERAGDVSLFSAPGEGREAIEIVRRVLDEAAAGVPFDEMAVLVRAPHHYMGLLEHACARADVPVYFDRGTRRPDPAGRAFMALLSCAVEGLSAKRFDEYLSLGQVPTLRSSSVPTAAAAASVAATGSSAPAAPDAAPFPLPRDEAYSHLPVPETDDPVSAVPPTPVADADDEAVVGGALRAPWKWEELIVESAVVGGRTRADGKARWRRRLDGLAADYRIRIEALIREDGPDAAGVRRVRRDLANLDHLRHFALPLVDEMADWPDTDSWGGWIVRLSDFAGRVLGRPDRVRRMLADFRPMAAIEAVTLEEVRDVVHDRLVTLDWDPPARRYGRLFVGTPQQARGRQFRVVFIPGLAERVVPQRPREDPLLLDDERSSIDAALLRQDDRSAAERLLLEIGIGAATERLHVSYPRMDVAETRARVPSFYALDVMRAITGRVPDHRVLADAAAREGGASLAWPAPRDADRAIDDLEHDLSVLKALLESKDAKATRGRAHYMLSLNDALRRSVVARFLHGRKSWSAADGLVPPTTPASADAANRALSQALAAHRLDARAYSLSALQRFSACPYQFLLATIHRLEPFEEPEPLVRMDPLTRGSLFHAVQAEFLRALDAEGRLPLAPEAVPASIVLMDRVLARVAGEYEERLAPAIDRVWRDEVAELRRDLGIWVRRLASDVEWIPKYFEFSFGLNDEGRDPRSLPDPVTIDGRFILRGSVDLIERHRTLDVLRVTDHKTGRNRTTDTLIVGGGATLQPVLYSVAIAQALGTPVASGRLFFCTTAGGFAERPIEINDYARAQGVAVLRIIDRAVERGFLPAAPQERACAWCQYRPVCGPHQEQRAATKAREPLEDLEALRAMR